jgi:rubrerythrin
MRELAQMSTKENLESAFAGESQANRKYLAFGEQAGKDGFTQVAKLFRAVAAAETIHAHAHLRALDGVKGTAENLAASMAGEKYEFTEMYPPMLETAKAEGHKKAERSMAYALEVEKVHYGLFQRALAAVEAGKDLPEAKILVCPVCGHTVIGDAPDHCPVCNAKGDKFTEAA